jgi:hypothetical protein
MRLFSFPQKEGEKSSFEGYIKELELILPYIISPNND